jgi:hypothetical protein
VYLIIQETIHTVSHPRTLQLQYYLCEKPTPLTT